MLFFEEMEPMYVIHNISIATYDDIIQFGDDLNIYTLYIYPGQLSFGEIVLIGQKRPLLQTIIFVIFLLAELGNHQ